MTQRPTGITILAIFFLLNGIGWFFGGMAPLFLTGWLPSELGAITWVPIGIGVGGVLLGALYFALGWGLWIGASWARIGSLILAALGLVTWLFGAVVFIAGLKIGDVALSFPGWGFGLLIFAVIWGLVIYYLLRPEVELFFSGASSGGGGEYVAIESTVAAAATATPFPAAPPPPTPASMPPEPRRVAATEVVNQQMPSSAWLVARSGARANKEFGLQRNENLIGRDGSQSDIVLDDSTVSKQHAKIRYENGQFVLYDMGSTNGTFVNNRRIQRQALMDGDDVRFGNVIFVFKEVRSRRPN